MGPIWAFGHETAVHALRLMGSGLFDKHPKLQIILGHMGEGLPFSMWRVDNCNAWIPNRHNYPAKKKIGDYFQDNFHITVSGNFRTQALLNALMVIGSDRIMFSTDWPFENIDHAALWFDAAPISEDDRLKIGRTNAQKLFKLKRRSDAIAFDRRPASQTMPLPGRSARSRCAVDDLERLLNHLVGPVDVFEEMRGRRHREQMRAGLRIKMR